MLDKHDPLPEVKTPVVVHRDVVLKMPETRVGIDQAALGAAKWVLQFDGGASLKQKTGSGGVLVWGPCG